MKYLIGIILVVCIFNAGIVQSELSHKNATDEPANFEITRKTTTKTETTTTEPESTTTKSTTSTTSTTLKPDTTTKEPETTTKEPETTTMAPDTTSSTTSTTSTTSTIKPSTSTIPTTQVITSTTEKPNPPPSVWTTFLLILACASVICVVGFSLYKYFKYRIERSAYNAVDGSA